MKKIIDLSYKSRVRTYSNYAMTVKLNIGGGYYVIEEDEEHQYDSSRVAESSGKI